MKEGYGSGLSVLGKSIFAKSTVLHPIEHYQDRIIQIIRGNALTIVGEPTFHNFFAEDVVVGFTALVGLSESHVALHTWFNRHYVDIDVFTCGDHNSAACEKTFDDLAQLFDPIEVIKRKLPR